VADEPLVADRFQPWHPFEKLGLVNTAQYLFMLAEAVGMTARTSTIETTIRSLLSFFMKASRR
jgi:hypothetical protein